MRNTNTSNPKYKATFTDIAVTNDQITGRGGLALLARYLRSLDLLDHLERLFGTVKKNRKGLPAAEILRQVRLFFMDGTNRHLKHFDHLREDAGYAAAIEAEAGTLVSSHALKRFLRAFWWPRIFLFRRLLLKLFIWRLNQEKPAVINLGMDTTVLNNDTAAKRHGVKATYKKNKGFQPAGWRAGLRGGCRVSGRR